MPVIATNPWGSFQPSITSPPTGIVSISPSDTGELAKEIRAIEAGSAGNVNVVFHDGTTGVFALAAGERKSGVIKQVKSTNTTAGTLTGYY